MDFPDLRVWKKLHAQDPSAVNQNFLIMTKIVVPAAFGVRMCFNCLQYQRHLHNPDMTGDWKMSCSDRCGSNASLMGGFAGIARAIAMAVEDQKATTPHTHDLAALSNVYSHNTLPVIAFMLEENIRDARHDLVDRMTFFCKYFRRVLSFQCGRPQQQCELHRKR